MRAELKIRVQEALNSMDPHDREVLILRHFADGALDLFSRLAKLLLEASDQLVFVAFAIGKIIVDEFAIGLLEFALDDIPVTLDLQFVHIRPSQNRRVPDAFACQVTDERNLAEKMKANLTR